MRSVPAARPGTMRSVGRLVLPALQAGRGAAAATQASGRRLASTNAAAGNSPSDPVLFLKHEIEKGIRWERSKQFCNYSGTKQQFDAFLAEFLASYARAVQLPQPLADQLMQQSSSYGRMSTADRQQLCEQVLDILSRRNSSHSAAATAPSAAAAVAARSNRGRAERAAAYRPPNPSGAMLSAPQQGAQLPAGKPGPAPHARPAAAGTQQPVAPGPSGQQAVATRANGNGARPHSTQQALDPGPPGSGSSSSRARPPSAATPHEARQQQPAVAGDVPPQLAAADSAAAAGMHVPSQAPATAMVDEWGLTLEQQLQQPFQPPPIQALQRPVPIIFDLETTSVNIKDTFIVELAALRADGSGDSGTGAGAVSGGGSMSGSSGVFSTPVRLPASKRMTDIASRVTGLSTTAVQDAGRPEFEAVYAKFYAFLQREAAAAGPDAYLLLIGHNIMAFDLRILLRHARAAGLPQLRHALYLDTYRLARAVFPTSGNPGEPENCRLGSLYQHYTGGPPDLGHRALEDCQTNQVVLAGLVEALDNLPPGGDLASRLHALALQQDPRWCGWVNSLAGGSAALSGRGGVAKGAAARVRRRPARPATAAGGGGDSMEARILAGGFSGDEDLRELTEADPLATAEAGGMKALGAEDRRAQVAAVLQGWRAVQQDPELRTSFLTTPVYKLKGKHAFTTKQKEHLQSAGLTSLGQVLECYPGRLLTSQPGRLPEEEDEDPVVTLAVRLAKEPKLRLSNASSNLQATFEVVHPSHCGLDAPWMPPDAYDGRSCKLEINEFRRGYARYLAVAKTGLIPTAGEAMVLTGPVKLKQVGQYHGEDTWQMESGKYRVLRGEAARAAFCQGEPQAQAQLQVVHPSKGDASAKMIGILVEKGLKLAEEAAAKGELRDPLPGWVVEEYGLVPLMAALRGIHQPAGEEGLAEARQRLAFQEFFALQLKLLLQRNMAWAGLGGGGVKIASNQLLELGQESLPFLLTDGQQGALNDILAEMEDWPPMQCMLQGDVGCGKTVVAFLALLAATGSGYQGAIMAPTEILAEQHHRNLEQLVQGINRLAGKKGLVGFKMPTIALVTGSVKGKGRAHVNAAMADGSIDIAVGTHALISESTQFKRLGLAIVDEQHKFGVEQRGRLLAKASPAPHVLHMTATPIPRTLALIDHGDMTQVTINELPAGRTPVKTLVLPDGSPQRLEMYEHIRQEMARGHGIYIVYPFVDTSDKMTEIKAATAERERLVVEGVFEDQDCGLLHGQLPPEEKDAVLKQFKEGRIKVLVSTTVVEVGVDVPHATVMVIEHAERFGYAQLHQLRGRVGRSHRQSYCYLVYTGGSSVRRKMELLEKCSNGFAVAECDLESRGSGEVLGKKQSGRDVKTNFKVAVIPNDRVLLDQAREAAARLLAEQPDPRQWSNELRALVADDTLLQLDTLGIPTLS